MNSKELAQKMLQYGELMEQAQALEKEIKDAVLEVGKTQTVGNVRATFSNPRKSYQSWEDAVLEIDGFVQDDYTEYPEPFVNWQRAGKDLKVTRSSSIPEGAKPTVRVKLI